MTAVIMLISLPVGVYMLFIERREMRKYKAIFDNFYNKVYHDNSFSKEEKIKLFQDLFRKNHYEVVETTSKCVKAEKKLFSMGWFFVGTGTLYVGLIVYIVYYFYFQKPHVVVFEI